MNNQEITKDGKKLMTNIRAGIDTKESIEKYISMLGTAFGNYAMIKNSLNIYTLLEMAEENREDDGSMKMDEFIEGIDELKTIMNRSKFAGKKVTAEDIADLEALRDKITSRMKVLTSYTDGLELYEYVLNRKEAEVHEIESEKVSAEELADQMFQFVFQNTKDTVLINTRIKDFVSQLPIRMTKLRFYDIISNALNLYKNGEKSALLDFISSIKTSVLMELPEGFDTEYPDLYKAYTTLSKVDYKLLDRENFDSLMQVLSDTTVKIEEKDTKYLMLQEVVNDCMIILLTDSLMDESLLGKEYMTAKKIASGIMKANEFYSASEEFDPLFVELEGAQEAAYETLSNLDLSLDELTQLYRENYKEDLADETIDEKIAVLRKADKLTSTSLFADLEKEIVVVTDQADAIFVEEEKKKLLDAFTEFFKGMNLSVKRSVMAKVLSMMPVFFNTQDEIKEYFLYALGTCGDQSELTACTAIVEKMMED